MDPVGLIVLLIILGVVLTIVPIEAKIKQIIIIIVVIMFCVWLLGAFGVWNYGQGHFRFR